MSIIWLKYFYNKTLIFLILIKYKVFFKLFNNKFSKNVLLKKVILQE